jgi:hypothetical protein
LVSALSVVLSSRSTLMQRRLRMLKQLVCRHKMEYYEDPVFTYTGYLEKCAHCDLIIQIPQ